MSPESCDMSCEINPDMPPGHTGDAPTRGAHMQRRGWLKAGLGLAVAGALPAALSGCGFKLREAPSFAFGSIHLGESTSPIMQGLRRQLEATPVQVTDVAHAQVLLDVLAERRERTVVGLNASGEVREITIRSRFRFRVRSHEDQELVPETELLREMDVSYAEAQALAKDAEVAMLFRSMEADTVQQIMRRLAMIRGVPPLPGAGTAGTPTPALNPAAPANPATPGVATPAGPAPARSASAAW